MKLNKKQKRTATIASMAALLAVVLGMGGQTFAKYISTERVETGVATVAKWGLSATLDVKEFFGKKYESVDHKVTTGDSNISVKGANEVVAPGTKGSMTITLGGTAEVDAKVSVDVDNENLESVLKLPSLKYGATTYYPIVWTVGEETANTPAELCTALELLTSTYEAEATYTAKTFTVAWEWKFYVSDANDKLDTILASNANGNVTIGETVYTVNTSLNLAFDVVFTQLD